MPSQQLKEHAAVAGFFELKSTQGLCGRPILHSDDSTVVMNVKDDARVGQKTASDRDHRCLASDSIIDITYVYGRGYETR